MIFNLVRPLQNVYKLLQSAKSSSCSNTVRRNISRKFNEEKYIKRDEVESHLKLIYKAPMEYYLLACAHVTSFTVIVIGAFGVMSYKEKSFSGYSREITYGGKLVSNRGELGFFIAGFIAINLALRIMVNRYPLRIYKEAER